MTSNEQVPLETIPDFANEVGRSGGDSRKLIFHFKERNLPHLLDFIKALCYNKINIYLRG